MSPELQQKLFEKYPDMFVEKDLPMTQTCMCWGIECGDGWFDLLDTLCGMLAWDIKHNKMPPIRVTQVKEKFGALRFYTTGGDERADGAISLAEYLSKRLCEKCGSPGKIRQGGWIRTLCDAHAENEP